MSVALFTQSERPSCAPQSPCVGHMWGTYQYFSCLSHSGCKRPHDLHRQPGGSATSRTTPGCPHLGRWSLMKLDSCCGLLVGLTVASGGAKPLKSVAFSKGKVSLMLRRRRDDYSWKRRVKRFCSEKQNRDSLLCLLQKEFVVRDLARCYSLGSLENGRWIAVATRSTEEQDIAGLCSRRFINRKGPTKQKMGTSWIVCYQQQLKLGVLIKWCEENCF